MSRVGIMGGSFDPIHMGHLITASYVYEMRELDKLILIPCRQSPHKLNDLPTASAHRLEMVRRAIEGDSRFLLSDFEIQGQEISYTIDTVKHFKKLYSDLDLIIGYDNLAVFDKWKAPEELMQLVNVVALRRKTSASALPSHEFFHRATIIDSPYIEISSTTIRERLLQGKSVRYLVPESTLAYIKEHNLYR